MIFRGFFLAILCLISSPVFAKKTFIYCTEGSPRIFNPQLATDGPTFNATSRPLYNRLVDFKYGDTKIVPSIAESWSVSEDGLKYTFKLRKDIDFHTTRYFKPTRKLNADDIVFSFNRMLKESHPFHKVSSGTYTYFKSMSLDKLIVDVKKLDTHRVQFELKQPEAPFLANLAMDFASILSKEYGDTLVKQRMPLKNMDQLPVGTGPFVYRSYKKDSVLRLKAHDTYFAGRSKLDNLIISITVDPSVRYQKLKKGECHLIAAPAPNDLQKMRKDKNLIVTEREGLNVGYLAMNVEKKPFGDIRVRQAINHALNRDSYLKAVFLGNAVKAKNPIPPTMWSYNPKTEHIEYDFKKARALLADAGFKDGFETSLWVPPISRPYLPNGRKLGEMIQEDLKKIGIKVNLVTHQWATYLDKAKRGEHTMILLGWTGDNGDPDNFLNVLLSCSAVAGGNNLARWCDKDFSELVDQAKLVTDYAERVGLYKRAQEVFKEKMPWVTIAHAKVFRGMRKNVVGFKMSPFGTDSFHLVDLK